MSIRLQLLIVALSTLVLPWAGWQYARELESALRGSQEQSLLASAGTIANALSAQPRRVFSHTETRAFDARNGDLYVHPLANQPLLDGYREDWDTPFDATLLPSATGYHARAQAGATERYLYLYIEVDDAHFDPEPNTLTTGQERFDRVNITLQSPEGGKTDYFFGAAAPGLTAAQHWVKPDEGSPQASDYVASEPRFQAFWLQTSSGYHLEARIPLSMVGGQLWLNVKDGGPRGGAGFSAAASPDGGRLFFATGGLDELLATFIREGTRVTVSDTNALKLGSAGALSARAADGDDSDSWYGSMLRLEVANLPHLSSDPNRVSGSSVQSALTGEPHAAWAVDADGQPVLTASAPVIVDGRTLGAVILEQGADQLTGLRNQALTRLFNLTLTATAIAVIVMLAFATWITFRIGRLRHAAESAVGNDGRIRLDMPESGSTDEIGALSRGFEKLLSRLNEHTQYLRTLGGKLSHELRTPLTIVRSSLDNLESEGLQSDQQRYIARAREGTQRLQTILTSLGAAARVEESFKQAERVNFDLRELLTSTLAAYRGAFPTTHFALEVPEDACHFRGAPDLMAQLLDKLIENAVDFCPPAGKITVTLSREPGNYRLMVGNDGPLIPSDTLQHLFESLYEQRSGRDDKPHFGLGLYIVRLIADFHGGTARAENREDGGGVTFSVTLPLI